MSEPSLTIWEWKREIVCAKLVHLVLQNKNGCTVRGYWRLQLGHCLCPTCRFRNCRGGGDSGDLRLHLGQRNTCPWEMSVMPREQFHQVLISRWRYCHGTLHSPSQLPGCTSKTLHRFSTAPLATIGTPSSCRTPHGASILHFEPLPLEHPRTSEERPSMPISTVHCDWRNTTRYRYWWFSLLLGCSARWIACKI